MPEDRTSDAERPTSTPELPRARRRRRGRGRSLAALLLLLVVVATVASIVGVAGSTRRSDGVVVRSLGAQPVPNTKSSVIASRVRALNEGDTVHATATLRVVARRKSRRVRATPVRAVCAISASRVSDPSFSLEQLRDPSEDSPVTTLRLRSDRPRTVTIRRRFVAPEADRYRIVASCGTTSTRKTMVTRARGRLAVSAVARGSAEQ